MAVTPLPSPTLPASPSLFVTTAKKHSCGARPTIILPSPSLLHGSPCFEAKVGLAANWDPCESLLMTFTASVFLPTNFLVGEFPHLTETPSNILPRPLQFCFPVSISQALWSNWLLPEADTGLRVSHSAPLSNIAIHYWGPFKYCH